MKEQKLVIFDCDGVLADSELLSSHVFLEKFAEESIPFSEEEVFRRFIGRSRLSCLAVLREFFDAEKAEVFWDDFINRLFLLYSQSLEPVAGVESVLSSLQERGIPFCLASSGRPEKIAMALKYCGLEKFFPERFRFSAVEVEKGKPAPDLFLHAAQKMGFAPSACLVIEDSLPGIEAALAAGMKAYAFCERSPRDFFTSKAIIVDSMAELEALLIEER